MTQLETDYLVIGSGAVGMSFVDTLLSETDASIIMVDKHHMPGGHWNDAYPFVRLHQPSAFYGVSSLELGSRRIDEAGSNKGYYELASGAEVSAYFDRVMRERFLPSGRVQYFPMHEYLGSGKFRALMSGNERSANIRKKTVDATYFNTSVPSTHKRKFSVADDVACMVPNMLPRDAAQFQRFTIVGAGKTAMDAGVWLLENGADPDTITWIRPRDSWLVNRESTQPGLEFFHQAIGGFANQMEAMANATSVDDLFDRMEKAGLMLRIDQTIRPEMFHFATISQGEIDQLQRIKNVVRLGHVKEIHADKVVLAAGEVSARPDTLYIDCTASAVERRPLKQVFDGDLITIQILRAPNPTFSAAMIAHVEAAYETQDEKNHICTPLDFPDTPEEWLPVTIANMMNQQKWSQDKALRKWITECRLDGFGAVVRDADKSDPDVAGVLKKMRANAVPGVMNLQKIMTQTG